MLQASLAFLPFYRRPVHCVRQSPIAEFLFLLSAPLAAQQQPTQSQQPPRYKQLAPGILASEPVFVTDSPPRHHVEIRDLALGPKQTAPRVPLEGFALMELRSGTLEVTINATATRREAGASWLVPRGARLAIKTRGEVVRRPESPPPRVDAP